MQKQTLQPSPRYLGQLYLKYTLLALVVLACLFPVILGGDWALIGILFVINLLWWIPAMLLSPVYYRSLRYELHTDEIIVCAGILTESVKHVPYRTVTNLTVKRGVLDRFTSVGTLEIQTAGDSSTAGEAEQRLVGLEDVDAIYALVAGELRRFRGASSPVTSDMEPSGGSLEAILAELRAIRAVLEQRR